MTTVEEIKQRARHMSLKDVMKCRKTIIFWCEAKAKQTSLVSFQLYQQKELGLPLQLGSITQLFTFKASSDLNKCFFGLYEWDGKRLFPLKLW